MTLLPIAASDMDMVIGVIAVIGWILAQIFGKKKGETPPGETPADTAVPTDSRERLRQFLDELEGVNKPHEAPLPVAPPPPPPSRTKPPRVAHETPLRRSHEHLTESSLPQRHLATPAAEAAPLFMRPILSAPTAVPALPELREPASLRKLIIATEILGKPIALRTNPS